MTSNEIFERLMEYRNESVRGDDELDGYFDAILASAGKRLGLNSEQAAQLAGDVVRPASVEPIGPEKPAIDPAEYEITDGYVGMFGKTFTTATADTLADAIANAAERAGKTTDEIEQLLLSGKSVQWCDSPNYYYDHGKGIIRRKRTAVPVQLVDCDCGHSVPRSQVMIASLGTACPDCYDRMSN